jgi:microcystin-dependent protein
MADVYLGSMMLVPYNFAPVGFAFCNGQLLSIRQYTALFSLLGTYYGGDGITTFGLPNLQGSLAIGQGQGAGLSPYSIGETAGSPTVTLNTSNVPAHQHTVNAAGRGTSSQSTPKGNAMGPTAPTLPIYNNSGANLVAMGNGSLVPFGGNGPHNNIMPYQCLQWIIALQGIFPPRG